MENENKLSIKTHNDNINLDNVVIKKIYDKFYAYIDIDEVVVSMPHSRFFSANHKKQRTRYFLCSEALNKSYFVSSNGYNAYYPILSFDTEEYLKEVLDNFLKAYKMQREYKQLKQYTFEQLMDGAV